MVADTGDAITHPEALKLALDQGWTVRTADPKAGTFHPKMMVGGSRFSETNGIDTPTWMIVGSGNLSKGGLVGNVETSVMRYSDELPRTSGMAFKELWDVGKNLNATRLREYATYFAEHNKRRTPLDLVILGIADSPLEELQEDVVRRSKAPSPEDRSVGIEVASAAWAGLESFTGEYTLQVEFPRDAGNILTRMLGTGGAGQFVNLKCEDGQVRQMRFAYYNHNSMFRLNVPNDVPQAQWVRDNKAGIALVEQARDPTEMTFRIVAPGKEMSDVIGRSAALGTWGKTPTRLYGWY